MTDVCLVFEVHQPLRLRRFSWFHRPQKNGEDSSSRYFDPALNNELFERVAQKCYLPTNKILLQLIKQHQGHFKLAFSLTGTFLEQCKHAPSGEKVLESFRELARTGCVEFLGETYYHSLSSLSGDWKEFEEQVRLQSRKTQELFGQEPKVFRNTEVLYSNEIAKHVHALGFQAILAEGSDQVLGWRSPDYVYKAKTAPELRVLLRNYRLSDDIGYRFSERTWKEWPLTAPKHAQWVQECKGPVANLFLDYETFGEHQWPETGIFEFLKQWPAEVLARGSYFKTPSEVVQLHQPAGEVDVPWNLSWADLERDESAWLGNRIQKHAYQEHLKVGEEIRRANDPNLLHEWRLLGTSDHFYYMCTKNWADGDVHKHFSPFKDFSPYDNFINYMNVLTDLREQLAAETRA